MSTGLDQVFSQGFSSGALIPDQQRSVVVGGGGGGLAPLISSPIPPSPQPYDSVAGLTPLLAPNVYSDVNSYAQGLPVGPMINPQMIQMAQNFANPALSSYNQQGGLGGLMPSGLSPAAGGPGGMTPMAGMQNQAFTQQGPGGPMPIQPYTMGR